MVYKAPSPVSPPHYLANDCQILALLAVDDDFDRSVNVATCEIPRARSLNDRFTVAGQHLCNNRPPPHFLSFWNSLTSNYSHVLCALIIVYFMCSKRTIHSYICLCDLEDILLIYTDISITLPENLLFSEIYTYVSNKLTYRH